MVQVLSYEVKSAFCGRDFVIMLSKLPSSIAVKMLCGIALHKKPSTFSKIREQYATGFTYAYR
jgi:hypothetical protein